MGLILNIIRKISFTGSTVVGKKLAAMAGTHMKLVTMELGGHAPAIIFEDADVDKAVNLIATNKYRNAGQVCVSPTRFLVHENLYDKFVEGFIEVSKNIQVGDGLDKNTSMGPLAHDRRLDAMSNFVSDAQEKGAKIKSGGHRKGNKGYFFEPTVFDNVKDNFTIMNQEPFGPLVPILSFKNFDEVIKRANSNDLGLASYIYTNNLEKAHKASELMETGTVAVNTPVVALPEAPFGGIKQTGYGREGGSMAIKDYLNIKYTHLGLS